MSRSAFFRRGGGGARSSLAQFFESRAGNGAHRHHRRALQKRAGHELLHFQPHQFQDVRFHQIGLGERHDALRDSQQAANVEVLARLRLDGFVRRDDEQHQIDAAHAGQHVFDETLVTRHVHEAQPQGGRQLQVRETDIDGDAAALLLFQPVRVDAGERLDQRGLAVIDVAGRAHDDVLHPLKFIVLPAAGASR